MNLALFEQNLTKGEEGRGGGGGGDHKNDFGKCLQGQRLRESACSKCCTVRAELRNGFRKCRQGQRLRGLACSK